MNIFKFAVPLAAIICFGAFANFAPAAESNSKKRSSSSTKAKKSSSSKKSTKSSKSSQSRKGKSQRNAKKKGKSERRVAKSAASNAWIDELPEVALPELSGPAEDELIESVVDLESKPESDTEPQR